MYKSFLFVMCLAAARPCFCQPFPSAPQLDPFGIPTPGSHYRIAFEDLDNDGDPDILAMDEYGKDSPFLFLRNSGSAVSPRFDEAPEKNPFGLKPQTLLNFFHLLDFDGDGDSDLFAGSINACLYFENIGKKGTPVFAAPVIGPFGIKLPDGSNTFIPAFGDLDSDGLLDLVIGDYNARLYFYKNIGLPGNPVFDPPLAAPFGYIEPSDQAIFLAPVLEDMDQDGLIDLLLGFNPGAIVFCKNTGTTSAPKFAAPSQPPYGFNWSNFNIWAMPVFYDLDGDHDRDIFISTFSNLHFYENMKGK